MAIYQKLGIDRKGSIIVIQIEWHSRFGPSFNIPALVLPRLNRVTLWPRAPAESKDNV